jgi:hypothetical protein
MDIPGLLISETLGINELKRDAFREDPHLRGLRV